MPHFKCVGCRLRLSRTTGGDDPVEDRCPGCGCQLEPSGELSGIVGFRAIKVAVPARRVSTSHGHRRLAARVRELRARDAIAGAQAKLDNGRWLDDGGSFAPEAVAVAVALPNPTRAS